MIALGMYTIEARQSILRRQEFGKRLFLNVIIHSDTNRQRYFITPELVYMQVPMLVLQSEITYLILVLQKSGQYLVQTKINRVTNNKVNMICNIMLRTYLFRNQKSRRLILQIQAFITGKSFRAKFHAYLRSCL